MIYVIMYLSAIVLANLTVFVFGAGWSIINAFLFIGLDLTARDKLHEKWKTGLWWKMALLIGTGSLLSFLLSSGAGQIALASFISFLVAGIIDFIVYQLLFKKDKLVKINGSNIFSAGADSIVFPTLAFGGFLPLITLGQFTAKVLGGFVWSFVLDRIEKWKTEKSLKA